MLQAHFFITRSLSCSFYPPSIVGSRNRSDENVKVQCQALNKFSPLPLCFDVTRKINCIFLRVTEIEGVPMSHAMLVNVFEHSHKYFSLGIRLYF